MAEGERMLTWNSYNVTPEELFDLFGKFGPIRYAATTIPQTQAKHAN